MAKRKNQFVPVIIIAAIILLIFGISNQGTDEAMEFASGQVESLLGRATPLSRDTILGGAVCEDYPSFQKDYTPSSDTVTRLNFKSTDHIGRVVQMGEHLPDGGFDRQFCPESQRIGGICQLHILQGETKYFTVEPGHNYRYFYYNCDNIVDETDCLDTDGGQRPYEEGSVIVYGTGAENPIYNDNCIGNYLEERYCDNDLTVSTLGINCVELNPPTICSNGACVAESCTDECTSGATECIDTTHQRTCGEYDSDGCYEWSSPQITSTCGSSGGEEIDCYTCSSNSVVPETIPRETKPTNFFQSIFGRQAVQGICEDQYGFYSHPQFQCEDGVAITNLNYFDPEIVSFVVQDSKDGEYKVPSAADLTGYDPGDDVSVIVEFRNKATFSTASRTGDTTWVPKVFSIAVPAVEPIANWMLSKAENTPVIGDFVDFTLTTVEWLAEKVGIKAGAIREDHNLRIINSLPEYNYVKAEVAFYSKEAAAEAYGYGRAGLGSRKAGFYADSLRVIPACQTAGGQTEDSYGYIKSWTLLMAPVIDGNCPSYNDGAWLVNGREHGGACNFKIKANIKVPDSGDITGSGVSNVDPSQEYYLHAAIFDRCYTTEAPIRELEKSGTLVQTGDGTDPAICCQTGGVYEWTTLSQCPNIVNQKDKSFCEGGTPYTKNCYRCTAEGKHEMTTFTSSSPITCDAGIAIGHKYSTEAQALAACYIDPPTVTKECYKCLGAGQYETETFSTDVTCGEGAAASFSKTSPLTCEGVDPANFGTCCKCIGEAEATCKADFPLGTNCAALQDYTHPDLSTAQSRCTTPTSADIGKAIINPDDDEEWCVQGLSITKEQSCEIRSYPRKENIFLSELDELDNYLIEAAKYVPLSERGLWITAVNDFNDYVRNTDEPICIYGHGDLQCQEDGECLRAINSNTERKADNKEVYDTLEPIVISGAFKFFVSKATEERRVEMYGVCAFEERTFIDNIRAWIADAFGYEKDDQEVTYIIVGGIVVILGLVFYFTKPRR